jgi:autotransporter-associated beta strand protein
MKLNVANSSLNRLVITAGTVQCVNSNTPAKTVEFQGGTLNENTGTNYAIVAAQGKSGTWNLVNDVTYSNKLSGEGTLTISCPVRSGGSGSSKWYATRTQVACDFSAFEGTLKPISNGDPGGRFTLNSTKGMPKGTMSIAADVEVQNNGKSFRIGKVTGSGKLGGSCTFSSGASAGANTWQVGNDDMWSTSVKVTANANLTKVGSGKVTWNGANDNTGNTTVSEGELAIGTATKLGTGKLTVAAGATLSGANNAKNALENTSVTINGTLQPGLAGNGSIFFATKAVTVGNQGTVAISATRCATATNDGCTSLAGISTLTMNGTFIITATDGNTLQPGDSIRIFTAQKLSGTPKFETVGNIEWDTSRISEGLLFVKSLSSIADIMSDRQPRNIYDLRGRLVKAGATNADGLKPGVYVVEGRKFSVK